MYQSISSCDRSHSEPPSLILVLMSNDVSQGFFGATFRKGVCRSIIVRRVTGAFVRLHPVREQIAGGFKSIPAPVSRKTIAILVRLWRRRLSIPSFFPLLASLLLEELFESLDGESFVCLWGCQKLDCRLANATVLGECGIGVWLGDCFKNLKMDFSTCKLSV